MIIVKMILGERTATLSFFDMYMYNFYCIIYVDREDDLIVGFSPLFEESDCILVVNLF